MVSLLRSYTANSGGVTFFSESVNMDDRENLQPLLDSFGGFKKIPTAPLFGFHLLCTLILDVIAIVYAVADPDQTSKCREYFIVVYCHIGLWILTFALHLITKCIHNEVRLKGYLEFHKNVETHASLPLTIVTIWTVALLFVQTLMQHFYPDDFAQKCLSGGTLSPRAYLCALITVEFFLLMGTNVSYMFKIIKFNRVQAPPDVLSNEWVSMGNPETFSSNEVGYRELGGKVYEFLEKQADLIRYLTEHNARLGERVMTLSTQLSEHPLGSNSV